MKKIYLILVVAFSLSLGAFSQSQRFVLFEEFTSASCSYCASFNPAFNSLLNANTNKCTSIKYQSNFGYDPMYNDNKADVNVRTAYYSVPGFPDAIMDGNAYHGSPLYVTQNMINNQYAVPSPFEITINQQLSPGNDSIYVTMLGKATAPVSGVLAAHCVIIEKHIHFTTAPGSNGEKDFYNVMKKMLPSASGTNLPSSFQVGDYFVLQFSWKLANVYNINELSVVGFIQDVQTKAVHQAANTSSTPITGIYPNDLELSNLGNLLPSYCETTFEPQFKLQNNGSVPLSSAEIKYRVNDGPDAVYQWAGSLGFLQKTSVSLPIPNYILENNNSLKIYGISTNGVPDDYPKNDSLKYDFQMASLAGTQVKVLIKTDNNPVETTWDIKDIQGNTLASGGPYTQALHTYTTNVDLGFGTCYEFTIYDSGNNGVCCANGNGFYKLSAGDITIRTGTSFGSSQTSQFYSQSAVGLGENPDMASFSVYPNPVSQTAAISFENAKNEMVSISVFNMQGVLVLNLPAQEYRSGTHEIFLDFSTLGSGVYTVRLIAGNKVFAKKITVSR